MVWVIFYNYQHSSLLSESECKTNTSLGFAFPPEYVLGVLTLRLENSLNAEPASCNTSASHPLFIFFFLKPVWAPVQLPKAFLKSSDKTGLFHIRTGSYTKTAAGRYIGKLPWSRYDLPHRPLTEYREWKEISPFLRKLQCFYPPWIHWLYYNLSACARARQRPLAAVGMCCMFFCQKMSENDCDIIFRSYRPSLM